MATSSIATRNIISAQKVLSELPRLVDEAHNPLSKAIAEFHKVDIYFQQAEINIKNVYQFITDLQNVLRLLSMLGGVIPGMGSTINTAVTLIQKSQLLENLRAAAKKVQDFILKVKQQFWNRVNAAFNNVNKRLETLKKSLSKWTETMRVLVLMFQFIDAIVLLSPVVSQDATGPKLPENLVTMSSTTLALFSNMKQTVLPIKNSATAVWTAFNDSIMKALSGEFKTVMTKFQAAANVVRPLARICSTVQDILKPIMPLLNGIRKIVDALLSRALKPVMKPLQDALKPLTEKVKEATGITTLQEMIEKKFDPILQTINDPLKKLTDNEAILATSMITATSTLDSFRKDPADHVVKLLIQASKTTGPSTRSLQAVVHPPHAISLRLRDPQVPTIQRQQKLSNQLVGDSVKVSDQSNSEIAFVKEAQSQLDTFVAQIVSSASIQPGDSSPAPKVGYAYFNEQPVSILIRSVQQPILDKQVAARTRPLPTLPVLSPVPVVRPGSNGTSFEKFVALSSALSLQIATSRTALEAVSNAVAQADEDFLAFDADMGDFYKHFNVLMLAYDAALASSSASLSEPLSYKNSLVPMITKLSGQSGLPHEIAEKITATFTGMEQISKSFVVARQEFQAVSKDMEGAGTLFANRYQSAAVACNLSRYGSAFGITTTNLRSVIVVLQDHLDNLEKWFVMLRYIGEPIIQNPNKLPTTTKAGTLAKVEKLYTSLLPLLESELNKISKIPTEVSTLYQRLTKVYLDVQAFFKVALALSQDCKFMEAKLIAADRVSDICSSMNINVLNLEGFLKQLGESGGLDKITGSLEAISREDAFGKIQALRAKYFTMKDLQTELAKISNDLNKQDIVGDTKAFDSELQQLVVLLQVRPTDNPLNPDASNANPLVDDATMALIQEITAAGQDAYPEVTN